MKWPNNKSFAFTIVDDTDEATVNNVKPVYDYLYRSGIITTKTVWAFPSRDGFQGETLSDHHYSQFIKEMSDKGYEIGFHGAGSGNFTRNEVLQAQDMIKDLVGYYPRLHINHALNSDNIYWNDKRFSFPIDLLYNIGRYILNMKAVASHGDDEGSTSFWGDFAKIRIKYIRNRTYSGINTIKYDKYMPYRNDRCAKYSNYWFSSSDAHNCRSFTKLLSKANIDRLVKQKGCSIIYTHFAYGFVDENGKLNQDFKDCIDYLISKDGWFVPASEVLDYINSNRNKDVYINKIQSLYLDTKWLSEKILRKIFGGYDKCIHLK